MYLMTIITNLIFLFTSLLSLFTRSSSALTPQLESHAHLLHPLQQQTFLIDNFNANNQSLPDTETKIQIRPRIKIKKRRPFTNLERKLAAGGGGGVENNLPIPTQYPTVTVAGSLFTVGTSVSATWKEFTQTFAATALGTWALGPTPRVGTIGLGTLQESVGNIRTASKSALQTSIPNP